MLAGQNLTASVLSFGVVGTPVTTSANGTATSGTTETFDTVLGYYQAVLIAGHRYWASVRGLIGNGGTAGDVYTFQIRDSGSSSNPTASSTLVAMGEWEAVAGGSSGRDTIPLDSVSFVASTGGIHTFGMSATRVLGTGVFTPVGTRELYVFDMGGN